MNAFCDDHLVGNIVCYEFEEDQKKYMLLTNLFVYEDYRGKGIATELLWHLYDFCTNHCDDIDYIAWGDCSDYYRLPNNIYLKIGAHYKEENDQEMIWDIHSEHVKLLREKKDVPHLNLSIIHIYS